MIIKAINVNFNVVFVQHLEQEGHDPATYKFELTTADGKTPVKKSRRTESAKEPDVEETPVIEDMIVQDTAGDDDDNEQTPAINQDTQSIEKIEKSEEKMDVDTSKTNRKRDMKDDSEATQAKKACMDKEIKTEDDHKIENNTDAEDSINLDIGDDELLNEEVCFYVFKVNVTLPLKASKISNGYMMEVD